MLKLLLAIGLLLITGVLCFNYLIKQSKEPSGFVGNLMMKIWNKAYLPMVSWSLKAIATTNPTTILDIGIGNGLSTIYLSKLFPNSLIYGIDFAPDAIKQAKKKQVPPHVSFEIQSIEKTSYTAQQFELICAFQTHFHWEDLQKSFNELQRLLAKNGQLLIACESAKLNYYLPDWQSPSNVQTFLTPFNLQLSHTEKYHGWVYYLITPY